MCDQKGNIQWIFLLLVSLWQLGLLTNTINHSNENWMKWVKVQLKIVTGDG